MAAAAARIPATEIEAYEDDKRLHFDGESDFPRFLTNTPLKKNNVGRARALFDT